MDNTKKKYHFTVVLNKNPTLQLTLHGKKRRDGVDAASHLGDLGFNSIVESYQNTLKK